MRATLTKLTFRSARRGASGIRNICVMSPHSLASSAVERPGRLIICGLRNRGHWGEKLAMNGQYPSAQLITGRYTVLATKNSGGERRVLIRFRMPPVSGGIPGTVVLITRATKWSPEAMLCLTDVMGPKRVPIRPKTQIGFRNKVDHRGSSGNSPRRSWRAG